MAISFSGFISDLESLAKTAEADAASVLATIESDAEALIPGLENLAADVFSALQAALIATLNKVTPGGATSPSAGESTTVGGPTP